MQIIPHSCKPWVNTLIGNWKALQRWTCLGSQAAGESLSPQGDFPLTALAKFRQVVGTHVFQVIFMDGRTWMSKSLTEAFACPEQLANLARFKSRACKDLRIARRIGLLPEDIHRKITYIFSEM